MRRSVPLILIAAAMRAASAQTIPTDPIDIPMGKLDSKAPPVNIAPPPGELHIGSGDTRVLEAPRYGTYGPRGKSKALCGGTVNGKLQPPCPDQPAQFRGEAVTRCPKGSFFDLGSWSCWDCPAGYRRSARAVDGEKACVKQDPSAEGGYAPAKLMAAACPKGSFWDPVRGGECWSCPAGFNRSIARVESDWACVKPTQEDAAPALRKPPATADNPTCGPGESYDPITGNCWACPQGYERSAFDLTSPVACTRSEPRESSVAKREGRRQCEPGEFMDPRNGGECWVCPDQFDRTVFPVTGQKACVKGGNRSFEAATLVTPLGCGEEESFSPATSRNKNVVERLRAQLGAVPDGLGESNGGTCWACPVSYKRSISPAWGERACQSTGVNWSPAPFQPPGLFGLEGGEAVAREVITTHPETVDMIAKALAPLLERSPEQAQRDAWEEIRDEPENSIVLKLAVLSRLKPALTTPGTATEAERKLAASFALFIQRYREYVAEEALFAAREWQNVDNIHKAEQLRASAAVGAPLRGNVAELFGTNDPPDFEALSASLIAGTFAGAVVLEAGILAFLGAYNVDVFKAVTPFRKPPKKASNAGAGDDVMAPTKIEKHVQFKLEGEQDLVDPKKAAQRGSRSIRFAAGKKIGERIFVNIGKGLAGSFRMLTGSIVFDVAVELIVNAISIAVKMANLIPGLEAGLAEAGRPVDLARFIETDQGSKALLGHWANAMAAGTRPSNPAGFADLAKSRIQKIPASSVK